MHAVERVESAGVASIQAGDQVIVTMVHQGGTVDMTVRSTGNDTLRGIDSNGRLWEIPMRVIESIQLKQTDQEKHFDPGKTLGLGLIGLITLIIIAGIAVSKALDDALDDHGD